MSVVRCCGNNTRPRPLSGGQSDRVAEDTITSWCRNGPLTSNNMIGERALHTCYEWLMVLRRVARSFHNFCGIGQPQKREGRGLDHVLCVVNCL